VTLVDRAGGVSDLGCAKALPYIVECSIFFFFCVCRCGEGSGDDSGRGHRCGHTPQR
jgi:hypothetical protein